MGEVLTQSQIDALLKSISGGGDSDSNPILEESTKKERKYDFHAPKRFTKDRIKLVSSIYTNYARMIASYLSSILRLSCSVEIVDLEEQRYYEFNNALTDNDVLSIIDVKTENLNCQEEIAMMQISSSVIYAMVDRLMGGSGQVFEDEMGTFTDIELSLYKNIILHILPLMSDAWLNYFEVKFALSKIETNPRLIQFAGMDDIVVIAILDITVGEANGKINICLPGNTVEAICKYFEQNNMVGKRKENQGEKAADDILTNIVDSMLEIKVKLGEAHINLNDVCNLKPGDIINLNKPKQSNMILYIEENPWFTGELGVQDNKLAVKINGSVVN